MSDTLTVDIQWGLRTASVGECAARLAETIRLLAAIHPAFATLMWTGGRKNLLSEADQPSGLAALFEPYRKYDENRKRRFLDGYRFEALTHLPDRSFIALYVHAGCDVDTGPRRQCNAVQMNVGVRSDGVHRPLLDAMVPALRAMALAWQPDYGRVWCHYLGRHPHDPGNGAPYWQDSWAFYLDHARAALITPPAGAAVEACGAGTSLCATTGPFEPNSSRHVEAAFALQATVSPFDFFK